MYSDCIINCPQLARQLVFTRFENINDNGIHGIPQTPINCPYLARNLNFFHGLRILTIRHGIPQTLRSVITNDNVHIDVVTRKELIIKKNKSNTRLSPFKHIP